MSIRLAIIVGLVVVGIMACGADSTPPPSPGLQSTVTAEVEATVASGPITTPTPLAITTESPTATLAPGLPGSATPTSLPAPTPAPTPVPIRTTTPALEPRVATSLVSPPLSANGLESVYLNERYQSRPFESAEEWSQKLKAWEAIRPSSPGLMASVQGAIVGLQASQRLDRDRSIRNDKWVHCVLGAVIASATDLTTATYAAWLKEYQDLTDGRRNTGFDEIDAEATVDGARQATNLGCMDCSSVCEQRWGDRLKAWDRTIPP